MNCLRLVRFVQRLESGFLKSRLYKRSKLAERLIDFAEIRSCKLLLEQTVVYYRGSLPVNYRGGRSTSRSRQVVFYKGSKGWQSPFLPPPFFFFIESTINSHSDKSIFQFLLLIYSSTGRDIGGTFTRWAIYARRGYAIRSTELSGLNPIRYSQILRVTK